MTARIEGPFVVFLIGMRINKPWNVHKWWPVASAMPKMLRELAQNPDSGFLGYQFLGFMPPALVQYWRSFEQLEAYARNPDAHHFPAWKAFNRNIRQNGDVGIWHETFQVAAGGYECIYHNMPPYGLGKATGLVPATGHREGAAGRMKGKDA